jgi:hypothetical protein
VAYSSAASGDAAVRTPVVYFDQNTFSLVYTLLDEHLRPQVEATTPLIRLRWLDQNGDPPVAGPFACTTSSTTTGVGDCTVEVPSSWFEVAGPATFEVYDPSNPLFVPITGDFVLGRQPVYTAIPSGKFRVTLPESALYPDDGFTSVLLVNTAGLDLQSWSAVLVYDATVLQFLSASISTAYDSW